METNGSPRVPHTIQVRKEVKNFIQATETLLSPIMLKPDLTQEECDLIAEYVKMLSLSKHPWSRSLPIKYT